MPGHSPPSRRALPPVSASLPPLPAAPPSGQVIAGDSLVVRYLNLVKFPHTLFALPFALVGVVAASRVAPVTPRLVALVVVAFTAARWVGVGANMIADRRWDALNPRNRQRELPRGALTVAQAARSVVVAALVFLAAAAAINPLCAWLAPVALAWVAVYGLTKRVTWWPHLWLGLGLAIAPVGGWLAVVGAWSTPWWTLCAIALAVTAWVGGFDILYALPDEGFDRAHGLRSAVVRLGVPGRCGSRARCTRRWCRCSRSSASGRGSARSGSWAWPWRRGCSRTSTRWCAPTTCRGWTRRSSG